MEINLVQILLQIVNFLIVLFVLKKFLYKPVIKILDERAKKINEGLRAAEKSLKAQTEIEERRREEIAEAQKEAAQILQEAKKEAESLRNDIVAQAKADASQVIEKERAALMLRLSQEESRLKNNIADLVASATRAVLQESLNQEQQQAIIKNQVNSLKKIKVS